MLKIGGFQPFTLTDYPGHLAAVVFTQGCNFRCPYCHNAALLPVVVPQERLMPQERVFAFLKKRQGQLDGLVVTGGEPTLQTGLPAFLKSVKSMGYRVKLDTNGSRPWVLASLIEEGLVDFIAMDVKAPLERYEKLAGVTVSTRDLEESIALIAWSRLPHQFRTTVVPALHTPADLAQLEAMLPNASPHRMQHFVPDSTLDPRACGVEMVI